MSLQNLAEPNNNELHLYYPPAVSTDWSPAPGEVYDALDQLADRVTPGTQTDIDVLISASALANNTPRNFIPNGAGSGYVNKFTSALTVFNGTTGLITFNKTGNYTISAFLQFEANATGNRYAYFHYNYTPLASDIVLGGDTIAAPTGRPGEVNISVTFYAYVGDTGYIEIFQNSGVALQVGGHVSITYNHAL